MRPEDYFEILNKGVKFWNQWRIENPKLSPDLSNLTISETKPAFPKADIEYKSRNLEGINFENVNFNQTVLRGVNLRNANLKCCNFYRADLRKANLSESDLSNAKLNLTNLTLANLNNSKLYGVLFWETVLSRTNLYGAKGLDTCKHGGPSLIDINTVRKSKGISDNFLKGIGLPEEMIQIMKSAITNFHTCFISYSHKDEDFVLKLWNDLQNKGVRCWYAPEDLEYGDRFREKIEDAIISHEKLIIVLSSNSMKSGWVEDEIETVMEKEYKTSDTLFIPIRIDDSLWQLETAWGNKIKRTRHIGDFSRWQNRDEYLKSFKKLIMSIKK